MDSLGTYCAFPRDVLFKGVGTCWIKGRLERGISEAIEAEVKILGDQDLWSASVAARIFWASKRVQQEWRIYPIA